MPNALVATMTRRRSVDEILLVLGAFFGLQPGVVAGGPDARGLQLAAEAFDAFARGAVDDAAFVGVVKDVFLYITFFVARAGDRKVEVGAVEAGGQAQGVPQAEQADDVLADLLGRGGRERATAGRRGSRARNAAILR